MRHDGIPRTLDDWITTLARRLETLERARRAVPSGSGTGVVQTVQAGTGIAVNSTDPANPIVSATGGGGGSGTVTSVTAGNSTITVGGTATDPTIAVNAIAESQVTNLVTDLGAKAPLASPTFTGDPKAPTPTAGDNDTSIATTAFVHTAVAGAGGGTVTSVTAGDATITIGGTATDPTVAVNAIPESKVTNLTTDLSAKAPLASPALTGNPTAPTATTGDNDTSIATTAFVQGEISSKAPLASPVFTGNPTAPTPTAGDNDTSVATTAFVQGEITAKAPLASPVFTGNPTAPTATAGDNDTSVATTAFVTTAVAKQAEVLMFALSDETTAITTGTKVTFRIPFAFTVSQIRASLTTASSSGLPTFDVKKNGTTVFSTTLTIDATEKTSQTAATAAVLSTTALADDDEIAISVTVAGTGATGAKVTIIGTRT